MCHVFKFQIKVSDFVFPFAEKLLKILVLFLFKIGLSKENISTRNILLHEIHLNLLLRPSIHSLEVFLLCFYVSFFDESRMLSKRSTKTKTISLYTLLCLVPLIVFAG